MQDGGTNLEEIASAHGDKPTIAKLNVDENPATSASYGITSIPTMAVFQNGQIVKQIIGAKPKAALLADLNEFINQPRWLTSFPTLPGLHFWPRSPKPSSSRGPRPP